MTVVVGRGGPALRSAPAAAPVAAAIGRALVLFAVGMAAHDLMMRWARGHPGRAALVVALQSWRTWRALNPPPRPPRLPPS